MLQEHFANDADAFYEVKRGRAWGALVFQQNYSESLVERTEAGRYAEDWVLEASNVEVKLDMSSRSSVHFFCARTNTRKSPLSLQQISRSERCSTVTFSTPSSRSLSKS